MKLTFQLNLLSLGVCDSDDDAFSHFLLAINFTYQLLFKLVLIDILI